MQRAMTRVLVGVVLAMAAWIAYPAMRARVLAIEETSAARGHRLALRLGCFSCHGPGGGGGMPNAGSEEGTVPAFTERTQMMYVKNATDLREYILDGAPRRKREDAEYRARSEAAALRMPAYRGYVTEGQLEDMVAYLRAASDQILPDQGPAVRGAELVTTSGCFGCHGPLGAGGVPNPGSEEGSVPAFTERTQMMYVKNATDLREYVLDGAPRRKREDAEYRARNEAAALRMPAYRGYVTGGQLEDLVAYLRAASDQILPDQALAVRGAELATTTGCFACHGPLGAGGVSNPGSLKGYIPSLWGTDFDDLVRDDEELHRWIAAGQIPRITEHWAGGWFFRRQVIKMPAYERFLSPDDILALVAYVRWIRAGAWQPLLR